MQLFHFYFFSLFFTVFLQEVPMLIREIQSLLAADVLSGEHLLDQSVEEAFASDMMSDVLAFANPHSVLLTGLCNPQVIRTAEMLDVPCIVFVRGKPLDPDILTLASDKEICVLHTQKGMYTTCGILYGSGL